MPYSLFHSRFPEIAEKETRVVTVNDPASFNLPTGEYAFVEMFCDEAGCDCRRVFFSVITSHGNDVKAVIAWGWEDRAFYRKWLGSNDPDMIKDLKGPILNLTSPQSDIAPALLKLFKNVLLEDDAYIERVKRHYDLFRSTVDKGRAKKKKQKRNRKKK